MGWVPPDSLSLIAPPSSLPQIYNYWDRPVHLEAITSAPRTSEGGEGGEGGDQGDGTEGVKEGGAKKIKFMALPALEAALLSYDMLTLEQRREALERSVGKGDSALVRGAVQRGFELDVPINEYGQTMVHVAAMYGQTKVSTLPSVRFGWEYMRSSSVNACAPPPL